MNDIFIGIPVKKNLTAWRQFVLLLPFLLAGNGCTPAAQQKITVLNLNNSSTSGGCQKAVAGLI
ncbi:MAG: hypothetical protein K0B11_19130 [Mariniphaga sp.]|nr:hypothetical protein [Mariniphaga sp.]